MYHYIWALKENADVPPKVVCNIGNCFHREGRLPNSTERSQRPRKHSKSGGALAKRGTLAYDQNQTISCRS
jgi:hypothetical protein